jgi:hypothetical protein
MSNYKNDNDYKEDSTMREIHRIQEEMERQYKKSGLSSYWDWLQATEDDLRKSLAEAGFEIVTRDGRTFLDEIKPRRRKGNSKSQTLAGKERLVAPASLSSQVKTAKHKNYDNYIEDSTTREMHLIREDRALSNKTETQPKKKHVKYKTAAKRRRTTPRK